MICIINRDGNLVIGIGLDGSWRVWGVYEVFRSRSFIDSRMEVRIDLENRLWGGGVEKLEVYYFIYGFYYILRVVYFLGFMWDLWFFVLGEFFLVWVYY